MRLFPYLLLLVLLGSPVLANGQSATSEEDMSISGDQLYALGEKVFESSMDSSVSLFEQALESYEVVQNKEAIIKSINTLATVHYYRNDFVQYRHYAEESVRRAAEMLGTQHMRYGESLNNLNTLFYELGDYSKSIALLEQSLQVQEQNQEHPVEMAFSYHNIGKVYRKKGDYPKALSYLKRALEFRLDSLGRIDYNIAKTFFDMGQVYADLERRDTARQYFTDCLDILGQLPSKNKRIYKRVVACHHALAELCLAEGELRTAFQYVDKALALEKEKGTLGRQSYSYELLGEIYQQQKRHSKAIAAFEKAIDISQDSYKDFSWPSQARTIKKMALALAASGQSKAALLQLQLALHKLSPTSPATEDFAQNPAASQLLAPALALDIIHQKAKLCRWLYQKNGSLDWLDAAHANYLAAARLSRHLRQSVQTSEGKIMLAANSLPLFEGGIQTAFQLYQHRQDRQYIQQAFQLIEANKAALLLDALLEESARGLGHIPDSLLQQEKRLSLERTFYQKKILSQKADSATVKKWEDQLFELSRQHERLVQQLETQFPLYHQAKYDRSPIDIDDLQQQETFRNSCLINYFVGDSSSFALAIGPEQLYFYQIEQASSHLEQVHHFHQSLSLPARRTLGPADYEAYETQGHQLYRVLLAPVLDRLPPSIQSLIIIPDHQLCYLPFGLLLRQAPPASSPLPFAQLPYVLRDYDIHYDYSANIHLQNAQRPSPPKSRAFLGFAPSFADGGVSQQRTCTGQELSNLRCNQDEVSQIAELMNGDVSLGTAADRKTFEQQSSQYQIIHLATHACVEESNALLSNIHFADDHLSNIDLKNLQLQADLAVLSACNTGSGPLVRGEGVMSLARSFMTAGCMSTVVSIWAVNDCTTSEIMGSFYRSLKDGHSKPHALRLAKLDYLSTAREEFAHPYYWGAFIQTGRPSPLSIGTSGSWTSLVFWGIGLLLLVILAALGLRRQVS